MAPGSVEDYDYGTAVGAGLEAGQGRDDARAAAAQPAGLRREGGG